MRARMHLVQDFIHARICTRAPSDFNERARSACLLDHSSIQKVLSFCVCQANPKCRRVVCVCVQLFCVQTRGNHAHSQLAICVFWNLEAILCICVCARLACGPLASPMNSRFLARSLAQNVLPENKSSSKRSH